MPDPDLLNACTPAQVWHLAATAEQLELAQHARHPEVGGWLVARRKLCGVAPTAAQPSPIVPQGIAFLLAKVAAGGTSAFGFVRVTLHAGLRDPSNGAGVQQPGNQLEAAALGVAKACGEYFGRPNQFEPHLDLPGKADGDSVGLATLVACVLAREPRLDGRPKDMPWRFAATGRWINTPKGGYFAQARPETLLEKLSLAHEVGYRRVLVVRGTPRPPGCPADLQLVEIDPDLRKAIRQTRRVLLAEAPPLRRLWLWALNFQVRGPLGFVALATLVVATMLLVSALTSQRATIHIERKDRVMAEYRLLHQNHRYTEALELLRRAVSDQADLVAVDVMEQAEAYAGQLASQLPVPFAGSDHRVQSNRDGSRLLGAAAGEAIEWALPYGTPQRRWKVTDGKVLSLAWRDELGLAVFASNEGTISWWDTRAEPVQRLAHVDLGKPVDTLAMAPDGQQVLAVGMDLVATVHRRGCVREFQLPEPLLERVKWLGNRVHSGDAVAFLLGDGMILRAAAPGWQFEEQIVAAPGGFQWSSLPWLPDQGGKHALGALMAPAPSSHKVARINLMTARIEQLYDCPGEVLAMAWPRQPELAPTTLCMRAEHPPTLSMADGKLVAELPAYLVHAAIDGLLDAGDAAIGIPHLSRLPMFQSGPDNAAERFEGKEVSFGTVSVLATSGETSIAPNPGHDVQPTAVMVLDDESLILTGDEAGVVRAFAGDLSTTRWSLRLAPHAVRWLGLDPQGELLAFDAAGSLHYLGKPAAVTRPSQRSVQLLQAAGFVAQSPTRELIAVAPDPGMYLFGFGIPWNDPAVLGRIGRVHLIQLHEGSQAPHCIELHEVPVHVRALAFSPDGTKLAIAGEDGRVEIRAVAAPDSCLARFAIQQQAASLVWSPDGSMLYLGCVGGTVVAFSTEQGIITTMALNPYATTRGGRGPVTQMAWLDDSGTRLCVGHGQQDGLFLSLMDMRVRIWDTTEQEVVSHLPGHPGGTSLLVALPSRRVLTGGADRSLRIWNPLLEVRPR